MPPKVPRLKAPPPAAPVRARRQCHRAWERWGIGTLRIVEECLAAGLPRPGFLIEMATFIVRFRPAVEMGNPAAIRLNERQRRALELVRLHGSIGRREYEALFDLSYRHAARQLDGLVQAGLLTRVGGGRSSRYVLAE